MDSDSFTDYYDYDYENYTYMNTTVVEEVDVHGNKSCLKEGSCIILLVVDIMIFVLGVFGNGVVIWISGLKMKKSVNTTWYLSLAVSDFVFCACLPLNIVYLVTSDWVFGLFMCKFTSFVMFLNMFSSIFLLVLISVDRCVSVVFPVWSQNHRTVRLASVLVLLAWIVSTLLSIPSLIYRDLLVTEKRTMCYNNYPNHTNATHQRATSVSRFVFGFVIPFLIITICYVVIIQKLRRNRRTKSSKPLKVMSVLIATFLICWLPYHILILLELDHTKHGAALTTGMEAAVIFANANSFLNPFLYAFMGKDFKKMYRNCILSKIENALSEDAHTSSRFNTLESRVSSHNRGDMPTEIH